MHLLRMGSLRELPMNSMVLNRIQAAFEPIPAQQSQVTLKGKARRGYSISVLFFPSNGAFTVCGRTVSIQQLLLPFLMRPPFFTRHLIGCYIYWRTKTQRKEEERKTWNERKEVLCSSFSGFLSLFLPHSKLLIKVTTFGSGKLDWRLDPWNKPDH